MPSRVMEIYGKQFHLQSLYFPFEVAKLLTTVCATGGGAYKFEDDFHRVSKGNFYEALAQSIDPVSVNRKSTCNYRNSMNSTLLSKAFFMLRHIIVPNVIIMKIQVILGELRSTEVSTSAPNRCHHVVNWL